MSKQRPTKQEGKRKEIGETEVATKERPKEKKREIVKSQQD